MKNWDPFRDLISLQEQMNRLFQDTMSRQQGQENIEAGQWVPAVDIFEENDRIVLRADLPGIEQDAIELRVDDGVLVIRGDRRLPADARREDFHRAERPHGTFVRSFGLPGNVDPGAIRAAHRNGVLEVILPKKQEAKGKAIRVDIK
ncbi:MAG: Hsp20/alpha crystallin family protein [Acidobacteria bacterium]|jgi:HSP20 family protein|nr:Hsp20/alpha crystallin family protein [Acidobacteriota bacterium]